jgi:hypothetical protein
MINFQNQFGQIDLSLIRDEDVAALDEPRRVAIHRVIDTVMARIKAEQSLSAARARVRDAMANEDEADARMRASSPPVTFADIHAASVRAYSSK